MTTNGGKTWEKQLSGTMSTLRDVAFINSSTAIIIGDEGTILKYYLDLLSEIEKTNIKLYDNYPNPFNSSTTIEYSISEDQHVSIKIYDVIGRELETLVNENIKSGRYGVSWNPKNKPSGVYYYRIKAGQNESFKKMLYLK